MPAPYTQVPGPRADGGAASVLRLNTLTIFSAFSGSSIEACSSAGETFIGWATPTSTRCVMRSFRRAAVSSPIKAPQL